MKPEDEEKLEAEILASYENDAWQSVAGLKEEIARYASAASLTLAKDKRINIRLASRDLEDIQTRAAREGMPYQTLIASVLHKYVTGRLIEAPGPAAVPSIRRGKKQQPA